MPLRQDDFERWYRRTYPTLYRTMLAFSRNPETAADVCAEAFLKALRRWPTIQQKDDPSAWLYRVAVNLAKRQWRRARREGEAQTLLRTNVIEYPHNDPTLWAAVDDLAPRQREVVILRYVADLTERQIADTLAISIGAASSSLSAARKRLSTDPRMKQP